MLNRRKQIPAVAGALLFALLVLVVLPGDPTAAPSHAQDGDADAECETLVAQAIQQVGSACAELGRNEVCYGNTRVSATLNDENLVFNTEGDIVGVTALEAIVTRPASPDSGEWGVALMDLQADLPEDADGLVRLVMFGGLEVTPARTDVSDAPAVCTFTGQVAANINMRAGPSTAYPIVDVLDQGSSVPVYSQNEAADWVRSARGWVYAPLGSLVCAPGQELATVERPTDTYFQPMQAFTLQVTDAGSCANAPSGMMVQAPDNQVANVLVNDVEIRVGSTAFITTTPGDGDDDTQELVIANLDGDVRVTANDESTDIPAGGLVNVPLSAGVPVDGPGAWQPLSGPPAELDSRILQTVLPQEISIPAPAVRPTGNTGRGGGAGAGPTPVQRGEGQWLPCGSCDTCGHPAAQCVTAPDGTCVWDPGFCLPAPLVVSPTSVTCAIGSVITIDGTYQPESNPYDPTGTIVSFGGDYDTDSVDIVAERQLSPTTFRLQYSCYGQPGQTTSISVLVIDSHGDTHGVVVPVTFE